MGRNGSGKTVLLKCICGLLKPDKGNIYILEKSEMKRRYD
ncbi:ATP-binding cassette domain-containing protein [Faecalimonas umbilicata]